MSGRGLRVALVGATGTVGTEILAVLEERDFPVQALRALASEESAGGEVEFRGEGIRVEELSAENLGDSELILNAAPDVLADFLDLLRESEAWLVDVSGSLELDPKVPLYVPGANRTAERWIAVPRGVTAGLGLALRPLAQEVGLRRATILCMEPASGAGRRGVGEFTEQTVTLLSAMTGETSEAFVFPSPLAFDCLPLVGEDLEGGESSEERRLRHVLRRLLDQPALPIEVTRVRAPMFGGSLACVHLELESELSAERARGIWEKQPRVSVLEESELPSPRSSMGSDEIRLGRIRAGVDAPRNLAFVLSLDDLRPGSALAVVTAAELLCLAS